MIKIRPSCTRGHLNQGRIESYRTFSNNSYWDPRYMNFGSLKVINEDTQQPGNIVPDHLHKNFDILGYMIEGELEHRDSLGNVSRARPGEIQYMWCGSGIVHSEASVGTIPARYCQLWITPKSHYLNTAPSYHIIAKDPLQFGPILANLHQDIEIHAGWIKGTHSFSIKKQNYLYILEGTVASKDFLLTKGDGAEITEDFTADFDAHILLFQE